MIAGRPTTASPRAVRVRLSITGLIFVRRDFAITAITLSKYFQGTAIFVLVEVRPISRRDVPFRICSLPDQEIAHTQLSRGTNDEVWIGHTRRIEIATDEIVGHILGGDPILHNILNRVHDLIA